MGESDIEMGDETWAVAGVSNQQGVPPRSPQQGGSPSTKKARNLPDPVPTTREAVNWLRHTIEIEATRKSQMTVEVTRSVLSKLGDLDTAIHDLVIMNLQLQSRLEESRKTAEISAAAAVAQFGAELRLREAGHEQTLEAVVARYTEKEVTRALEVEASGKVATKQGVPEGKESFAQVAGVTKRQARKDKQPADREVARSKSRASKRSKLMAETKEGEHRPAFVIKPVEGTPVSAVSTEIWRKVVSKKIMPRCQTITTKQGKVILKPLNKETADVLRYLAKDSGSLQEEELLWPRFIIKGVQSTMTDKLLPDAILDQNPELGIDLNCIPKVIRPIFKTGPKDRDTTNWVVEINPAYHENFARASSLYIGFMCCRLSAYEEVTQCHSCLRYGHLADKYYEKIRTCAHCGRKGHLSEACPAAEGDPICANCKGKHNARDKTCSSRTNYLLSIVRRTDYGKAQ